MKEREPIQEKKKPITDIELSPDYLEEWEKMGLSSEIEDLIAGLDDLMPEGDKLAFHPADFESTSQFMEKTEHTFADFDAKNRDRKIKEVEALIEKVMLNFAFRQLGFDVYNPQLVKEEKINLNKKEIIVRYFATNQPDKFLVFDGERWYLTH